MFFPSISGPIFVAFAAALLIQHVEVSYAITGLSKHDTLSLYTLRGCSDDADPCERLPIGSVCKFYSGPSYKDPIYEGSTSHRYRSDDSLSSTSNKYT